MLKKIPVKLTYYYIDHGEKVELEKSPEEIEQGKKDILEIIEKIKRNEFSPTPSPFVCKFCNFKRICSEAER